MKPDWKDAPEWANWLAQDITGKWFWYDEKPLLNIKSCMRNSSGRFTYAGETDEVYKLEYALEQRPTEVELEYVDPYDQKLEPEEDGPTVADCAEKFHQLQPGEFLTSPGMEVQEGAVMNTPGYEELAGVLVRAYDQAASGKGKERHANDLAFVDQPMQMISDLLRSHAGMAFQAVKKIIEAQGLPTREAQVRELLGAINYVAGMVLWLEKQPRTDAEAEDDFEGGTGSVSSRRPELLGGVRSHHDEDLMYVPSAELIDSEKQRGDISIKNVWSGLPTPEQAGEGLKEMLRVMNSNPERLS